MAETVQLDDTDRRLLRVLQRDGRISNLDLAQQCHLSPSACSDRVRRLRERGAELPEAGNLRTRPVERGVGNQYDGCRGDDRNAGRVVDVAERSGAVGFDRAGAHE